MMQIYNVTFNAKQTYVINGHNEDDAVDNALHLWRQHNPNKPTPTYSVAPTYSVKPL